ncbi:MAG: PIN domain-containing protein [Phycisphaerales bacterium]|nr:PIN domain-containing protein [Phycisphaerales bacterium]
MADILIDTTIAIDASNENAKALNYVRPLLNADQAFIHAQVVAEVISATRDAREQSRLLRFLRQFHLIHSNEADSNSALQFLTRFHLSHNLDFGDCLIGTTALRLDLPVATLNDRHFRLFKDLTVIRPY